MPYLNKGFHPSIHPSIYLSIYLWSISMPFLRPKTHTLWCRTLPLLRAQERPATLILTLTSGLCIARARQVYNRDTETGSWNFVVPLRTIRMRKMCQSQQFVTWVWNTGCRLLSHGRSKRLSKLLLLRLKLSPEKIKTPAVVEKVFSSLELEAGTYTNLYSYFKKGCSCDPWCMIHVS